MRGVALVEALVGGVILSVGLAVIVSLVTRSLAAQQAGEQQVVAAALLDELLSTVLVEGPIEYPRRYDMAGRFEPPFEQYDFQIEIEDQGEAEPFLVTATVHWGPARSPRSATVQTLISWRGEGGNEPRAPREVILR
jgi:hypothetical protein